jgi:NitT/TauT family transport system substrate-binding protein
MIKSRRQKIIADGTDWRFLDELKREQMQMVQTRRLFLGGAALAGTAALLPARRGRTEPALETTSVRLAKIPGICIAPQYVAEELLRAEGFTDVRYVANGSVDLAGAGVRGIADLRGKRVGFASSPPALLILMAVSVGLDRKDIDWVTDPKLRPLDLFADRKIDAFLGFPPEPQELRARHASRVIVNTALDRPWSQYFCCMLVGNREFVRKNPVAAQHVVRAILKATDLCDSEPERVDSVIVDRGFADRSDPLLQILKDNPYKWREYNAEDTVRFYALRLQEMGLTKSTRKRSSSVAPIGVSSTSSSAS